jgi:hypothetical protein
MFPDSSRDRLCMYTALTAAECIPRVMRYGEAYSDLKDT